MNLQFSRSQSSIVSSYYFPIANWDTAQVLYKKQPRTCPNRGILQFAILLFSHCLHISHYCPVSVLAARRVLRSAARGEFLVPRARLAIMQPFRWLADLTHRPGMISLLSCVPC